MRRQDKYQNNKYFNYYNANSYNKISGDCAIRAICTLLKQSWEQTALEMAELGMKYGYVQNDKHTIDNYLKSKGYIKCNEPRKADNTRMTVREFIDLGHKPLNAVAYVGTHHIVAIEDNVVYDIWDSSKQTLHSYYIKEE